MTIYPDYTRIRLALADLPEGKRPAIARWLKAARRRITPRDRWTTGMMRRPSMGPRPAAFCALGSLNETLHRQKDDAGRPLNLDTGLGHKTLAFLNAVSDATQGGDVVTINDGLDGHHNAHERVLSVFDAAVEKLEAK